MRIIFHVDVNNAFLSWTAVDLLNKGEVIDIRKIPSVIGGDEALRHGIVLARSIPAKKCGVLTAETLYSARKKCPDLKVFPSDYTLYSKRSSELFQYLSSYTPLIERFSVDECFLDMSDMNYLYDDILTVAYKIRDEIKEKFGYTVNVGIGNNKLCAKMASDFTKPFRVHTLFMNEVKDKMWPLDVNELFMVGKKSSELLKKVGIYKIEDLAKCDVSYLRRYFKNNSEGMILAANGIDDTPVVNNSGINKCISVSSTLVNDTSDVTLLKKVLLRQCNEVGIRLRKQKMFVKTVAITLKNSSFKSYSHQGKIEATDITLDIYNKIISLFDSVYEGELIRNIGVRLSDLTLTKVVSISLFDTSKFNNQNSDVQGVIDLLNNKYNELVVGPASLLSDKMDDF